MNMFDKFLIAITPESVEEKNANAAMLGVEEPYVGPDSYMDESLTVAVPAGSVSYADALDKVDPQGLSIYEKFIIAVTPESEGERIANYNMDALPGVPLLSFDPDTASTPAVIATAQRKIGEALNEVADGGKIIVLIVVVVLALVFGIMLLRKI